MFSLMLTCCLVVGLGLGLDFVFGWRILTNFRCHCASPSRQQLPCLSQAKRWFKPRITDDVSFQ